MICETEQRTPDLPCRIIGGNYGQSKDWANREGLPAGRWRHVSSAESLYGVRNVRIVWVGTFWRRPDFGALCDRVDQLVALGEVVVDRNEVIKGRKARKKTDSEGGTETGAGSGSSGLAE